MIYTSYFSSRKYNPENAVSISRSTPNWLLKNGMAEYKDLAPSLTLLLMYKDMVKAGNQEDAEDMYAEEFNKKLSKMDPEKVYNDLDGKILLCYEKTGNFCHRNLVAEWLIKSGYDVNEL